MRAADAATLAALAGEHLDLVRAPFTLPRSRLLVFREGDGVRVHTAEYERSLAECRVLDSLMVRDADGDALPITRVLPHAVEFDGSGVSLAFAGPHALTVGLTDGRGANGSERIETRDVIVEWTTPEGAHDRIELTADGPAVRFEIAADRSVRHEASVTHAADQAASEAIWLDWFGRCPRVRPDLQAMTAFCWWVLGANIVELPALGGARAVVPSKIGYVGLWQWDAYFIAVGLRHGDPALAREQLELAFRFPSADGQLPDVVHEHGVLATSDDLPPGDRETLRRAGSAIADPTRPVPLTKPPLAAWALRKVMSATPGDTAWAEALMPVIADSQDWWFAGSDLDGDGMPEYAHPYSSGLDDSPIFDGPLPTTSPDLGAYLVLQDAELAGLAEQFGAPDAAVVASAHRARSQATLDRLLELWDEGAGFFRARAAGEPVASHTVVSLLPLLAGRLPEPIVARMLAGLGDEQLFGTPWGVPTVATSDPDFSPERMWRGPVWININTLLVEGLRMSGRDDLAVELAERTVALVKHGGGPHEYFNPYTGQKAHTATTAFGWSAALFIELAVQLSV